MSAPARTARRTFRLPVLLVIGLAAVIALLAIVLGPVAAHADKGLKGGPVGIKAFEATSAVKDQAVGQVGGYQGAPRKCDNVEVVPGKIPGLLTKDQMKVLVEKERSAEEATTDGKDRDGGTCGFKIPHDWEGYAEAGQTGQHKPSFGHK